jgi:hypothetical protein
MGNTVTFTVIASDQRERGNLDFECEIASSHSLLAMTALRNIE